MKPNFYAVIPANVRYSDLKANAKLLYGEITALSYKEGYCFATNRYFAELYGVTKNTVSLWVSQLHKKGFISIELIKKGEQITERRLYIINKIGIINNDDRANIKNDDLNNTRLNITNNISNRKDKFLNEINFLGVEKDTREEFISYWTEENKSRTKMRFELEKTWDTKKRLERWINNTKKWQAKKPGSKIKSQLDAYSKAREMMKQINNK
jgi:DNA-binding transcriptional regulator YhcF (GntR family)